MRAEAYAPLALPATRALERANVAQVRDGLVALGLGDDIEPHLAALDTGTIDIATPPLVTAWGRKVASALRWAAPLRTAASSAVEASRLAASRAHVNELGREDSNP